VAEPEITLYGTNWCGDCKRAKQFFGEQRVHYRFVDVDVDSDGLAFVEQANDGKRVIPVIVFGDGSLLVEPSNAELAAKLGLKPAASRKFYDVIIVGSGPAGLTAALYTAREGIDTLVIERSGIGGQAGITERLDNFPGFPEGVSGDEFAGRLRRQAERFGVEVLAAQEVTAISLDGSYRCVKTADGMVYGAYAVLLALGSTYRRLGIPGEEDFIGAGVHFCATCDGPFYRGEHIAVIGGGNSAGEEGLFLTKFADRVTIVTRDPALSASKSVVTKIAEHDDIEVVTGTRPVAFKGSDHLNAVTVEDLESGEKRELNVAAAFVFIGLSSNTEVVKGLVALDPQGFVVTDSGMATSVPGLFAAGDCRAGSTKQAASAAGEGAAAAIAIRRYVEPLAGGMPEPREPRVAAQTM
jgi:thioredoxin reductase (NADPH)